MDVKDYIDQIRDTIGRSTCDERALYEALMAEAEGWKMRLQELEDE